MSYSKAEQPTNERQAGLVFCLLTMESVEKPQVSR